MSLVLPGTGFGALLHLAAVDHHVCFEHGQLAHGAHAVTHGAPDSSGIRSTSPPAEGHTHRHCLVGCTTHVAARVDDCCAQARAAGVLRGLTPAIFEFRAEAILRLAPKGSPPV